VLAAFVPRHNARFAVEAADPLPAWRPLPTGTQPEALCCFEYPRRVARDATVRLDGEVLALPPRADRRSWAGRAVIVQERLDGSRWALADGGEHLLTAAPPEPATLRARDTSRAPLAVDPPRSGPGSNPKQKAASTTPKAPGRPAADHPWRRSHTGFSKRR